MSDVVSAGPVLACDRLAKSFGDGDSTVHVLRDVTLAIDRAETGPSQRGENLFLGSGCLDAFRHHALYVAVAFDL